MKLLTHKIINGEIECITGLHIGGSAETIEIGGMDNPIIKHPITRLPYVPGSSIKGRMRSLLELKYEMTDGDVHQYNGKNCGLQQCKICRIFGTSADVADLGPSRLIVRDAHLTKESEEKLKRLKEEKGLPYSEEKWENRIDRVRAKATPRQVERVPSGIIFKFELVYRIFDTGDGGETDENLFDFVKEGLKLIENDALGGYGSRGSGKVKFTNIKLFDSSTPDQIETIVL